MVVGCWASLWPPVWEVAVHLAVACDVYGGVFCAVFFPAGCLGWGLGLGWVGFWGFSFLLFQIFSFMIRPILTVNVAMGSGYKVSYFDCHRTGGRQNIKTNTFTLTDIES